MGAARLSDLGEVEGGLLEPGETRTSSRLNFDIRTEPARVIGLALEWPLSLSALLRVSAGFASTEFAFDGGIVDQRGIHNLAILGGFSRVYVSTLDAAIVWSLAPPRSPVSPYALLGAGATIFDINDPADLDLLQQLTGVNIANVPRTDIAPSISLGVGAKLLLGRGPLLHVELSRHVSSNPLSDADLDTSGDADFVGITDAMELIHQTQLRIGLSIPITR